MAGINVGHQVPLINSQDEKAMKKKVLYNCSGNRVCRYGIVAQAADVTAQAVATVRNRQKTITSKTGCDSAGQPGFLQYAEGVKGFNSAERPV